MKITVYTIKDCPFCKQEKEYLTAKGLQFEEKNVQENKEHLAEMLQVSNKFAGVPFTVVELDNGQKEMLKGFTPAEFDKVLGGEAESADKSQVTGDAGQASADKSKEASAPTPVPSTPQAAPAPMDKPAAVSTGSNTSNSAGSATPPAAPTPASATPPAAPSTPPVAPKPAETAAPASTNSSESSASSDSSAASTPGAGDPQDALNGLIKDLQSDVSAQTPTQGGQQPTAPSQPTPPATAGSATPPAADALSMPDAPKMS